MYLTKYYTLDQISILEHSWKLLEVGHDMTYFQRYEWYKMLAGLNVNKKSKSFKNVIVEVLRDGKSVLIVPLWIVQKDFGKYNHRGIYFFARGQWSDYQNFIYDKFDPEAVNILLNDVTQKYNVRNFIFEDVPKGTKLFDYINSKYTHLESEGNVCVELNIPSDLDSYHKMLSKSVRQNIRTAFNRAEKDGVLLTFNFDDQNVNIEEFKSFREAHLGDKIMKGGTTLKSRLIYFISTKILGRGVYEFYPYTPFQHDPHAHFITCRDQNNRLCAAYCYGIDKVHNKIVLMAVATNANFYRYSPGILSIYKFVLEQMEKHGFAKVDFTRGNEIYKYSLGGVNHYNHNLTFSIEK